MKKIIQVIFCYLFIAINYLNAQTTQQVTAIQYYFDTDPGIGVAGNGAIIPVPVSGNSNQSLSVTIPGTLGPGMHTLFIRAKDEFQRWGIAQRSSFYVQQVTQQVTAIQYYFDNDPGIGVAGNGAIIPVPVSGNSNQSLSVTIPGTLATGMHTLFIRAKDEFLRWGIAQRSSFYVQQVTQQVTAIQYYFDTDPGIGVAGNGAIIPVPASDTVNQTIAITIPGALSNGHHYLFVRTKDEFGTWSIAERKNLQVGQCADVGNDSIASWWTFDEGSTEVTDNAGNHNGLAINGTGIFGYAQFDGGDDYIGIPDNDAWAFGTSDFSIEFRTVFASLAVSGDYDHSGDRFIGQSEGFGAAKKWTIAIGNGDLFFRLCNGSTIQNLAPYPFTPVLNQWYHIALTRSADTLRTYINGALAGSQVVSNLNIPDVNAPLTIGWSEWLIGGDQGAIEGKMDEVTIYNRTLSTQEILSISNAGFGGKCKNIQISTPAISDAQFGNPFTQTLSALFGNPPYTWSVVSGALPVGITLSAGGVLSGTPTEAGEFSFTVQVTDVDSFAAQNAFTQKVLLTLPEGQFTIFKSGTVPVPGREMDYFILVENESTVMDTASISEFLEPWFTYVSSNSVAEIIEQTPNYFIGDTLNSIPSIIRWNLNLIPEEKKIVTYKVKLSANTPLNSTVKGEACINFDKYFECGQSFYSCLYALKQKCYKEAFDAHPVNPIAFAEAFQGCVTSGTEKCWYDSYICCVGTNFIDGPCFNCGEDTGTCQQPVDPNEKLVLAPHYIKPEALLPYVIHFENIGTIEAQDVFITDTLDVDLDETTLNILSPVGATFDTANRVLRWELYDINLMPDSSAYVMYTAKPKPNLPSGTVIRNTAYIQFEVFDVFATNQTENIIDYSAPTGIMDALPDTLYQTAFPISWGGTDSIGEIKGYSIFIAVDNGGFEPYLTNTKDTFAIYTGETGKTYKFICIAEDVAGNIEVQEPVAEAATHLTVLCSNQYFYDADDDGYGNVVFKSLSCSQPLHFVPDSTDCNDANSDIHPATLEICNFTDDDCDGLIDEGVKLTIYLDTDHDGYGNPDSSFQYCSVPYGFSLTGGDCNNADSAVHPGLPELCNGKDDNCNGQVDEGCATIQKFIVVDIVADKKYRYDSDFNFISTGSLSNGNSDAHDVAVKGNFAYVLDCADKKVYRYGSTNSSSRLLKTINGIGLSAPTGLAISGDEMWVVDSLNLKIYKYSLTAAFTGTGGINATFEIPLTGNNDNAEGLGINGSNLYVVDNVDKRLYRYPKAGGNGTASKFLKETGGSSLGNPSGIAIDDPSVWIVDRGKDKAYQYTLSALFPAGGGASLNASAQFLLNNQNGDATGIAVKKFNSAAKFEDEIPEDAEVLIYPNPTTGKTNIMFSLNNAEDYMLNVMDITGRLIVSQKGSGVKGVNVVEIDLNNEVRGVYILQIACNLMQVQKKIILK